MVARLGVDYGELMSVVKRIGESLSIFMSNPEPLIREVAAKLNIPEVIVRDYLTRSIRYVVDDEVIDGIRTELDVLKLPKCLRVMPR
jgi:predicted solute-binding protein